MATNLAIVISIDFPLSADDVEEKVELLTQATIEAAKEVFVSSELLAEKYHPSVTVTRHDTLKGTKETVFSAKGK